MFLGFSCEYGNGSPSQGPLLWIVPTLLHCSQFLVWTYLCDVRLFTISFQGSNPERVPRWLKSVCGQLLTQCLLRKEGLSRVLCGVFDACSGRHSTRRTEFFRSFAFIFSFLFNRVFFILGSRGVTQSKTFVLFLGALYLSSVIFAILRSWPKVLTLNYRIISASPMLRLRMSREIEYSFVRVESTG